MHPNEGLIRKFFDFFSRGDMASASSLFHEDVAFHVPGRNPLSGEFRGRDEWLASLAKYAALESAGVSFGFEVHDVLANDQHAVALLDVWANGPDDAVRWQRVAVYHLRDGKIEEVRIHDVDQYAVDDFLRRASPS